MKTIKILVAVLIFFSSIMESGAQQKQSVEGNSIIKGILTVSKDTTHIGFANVVLYKMSDSSIVTWTISKDDGSFELTKVPTGTYNVVSTSLGYEKNVVASVSVNKPGTTINLGKIELLSATAALGEILVVGERKTVDSKIDRKVINVSRDINSTGGTTIDLLRNVPGLSVNTDGSVSIRGSSDVSVLIDGRPTSIDATKLEQISSGEIESIEIITNPTAKYNPEGKSGIINLKMKQKKSAGFNGNAMITAGTGDKYNAALGLNYNFGNVNFFGSYNGIFRKTGSERYLLRESYISDSAHFVQQNSSTILDSRSNKFTLGTNINLNSKNSLTLSYSYNPSMRSDYDSTLSQYLDESMNLTKRILTKNSENINGNSHDYILSYRKTFDRKGEEITIDYNYASTSEVMDQLQDFNFYGYSESAEIFNDSKYRKSNLQVNWILPVGKTSSLETGLQSIMRATNIDYFQNNLLGDSWVKDEVNSNNFIYDEQIHSVYSTFSGKANDLSYIAGLRLEQSFINGDQTVNREKINQDYFNLYPSVNFKYTLDNNNSIQLSYSRRINRPAARQLNPFIDKSNQEVYRSGNPNLMPEYVNSIEAGFNGKMRKSTIGFTLFNNNITNPINMIAVLDSAGISHMFPENISSGRNYGFELIYEVPFTKWWKLSSNGSLYKNIIKSETEGLSNSNFSYNARINNLFTIKKTTAQLVVMYTGPIIAITSKMEPQFSVDLAIKRDIVSDKLSITARATDIFNTLKNSYTAWGTNYTAGNWRKPETEVFYLSLIYNFGKTGSSKNSKSNLSNESVHSKEIN
ncbi:MAG TPA: TonB-dependent receptor [Lentimicrobium sp.]|nr:TonB-dependent receptor [Lentimicrobium sp.]